MNEYLLQTIAGVKLVWVSVFASLYGFGGISNKWLRRFVGAFWVGVGVFLFSLWSNGFKPWYVAYPILLMASLHLGYGADKLPKKVWKRFLCGLAVGLSSAPLLFPGQLYALWGYGVGLSVINSILLGAFNICKNARDEETLVAAIGSIIPLFLI